MAYRSVAATLAWALAQLARAVIAQSRPDRPPGVCALSPYERIAQAALVCRLLTDHCRAPVVWAAIARYRPVAAALPGGWEIDIDRTLYDLTWHVAGAPPLAAYPWAYLRDQVAAWAGLPVRRSPRQWAATLGVSARMLRYVKYGNAARNRAGVWSLLDDLIGEADAVLLPVFAARGLITAAADVC